MAIPVVSISDLTTNDLEGSGVFDVLMRVNKSHLESEFQKNRIKGTEYATVYLGSLDAVMKTALEFLLQRQRVALEAQLMEQQVLVAQAEVQKANAQVQLAQKEVEKITVELEIMRLNKDKIPYEIAHLQAQTKLVEQQELNLKAEVLNTPKQGALIDAQASVQNQQITNLVSENLKTISQTALTDQQKANAVIEGTVLQSQKLKVDADVSLTNSTDTKTQSENALVLQKTATEKAQISNDGVAADSVIGKQNALVTSQTCKLDAEYDVLLSTNIKTQSENSLLLQKVATEKAQISSSGVDDNSVIGKQKKLYQAQTDGFSRDAEQKAAKIMVDSWNVRRTTDEATVADGTNMLADVTVGRTITKLLAGVGA